MNLAIANIWMRFYLTCFARACEIFTPVVSEPQREGTPESGCRTGAFPLLFHKGAEMSFYKRGATWAEVSFFKSIIGNFIVYNDWIETNLLQLFAHAETSEQFSVISGIIFEVSIKIVAEHKQAQLVRIFFINLHCTKRFYCTPARPLFRGP